MQIVCLSGTHNYHEQITVPDGDLLIHSGAATINGSEDEINAFFNWFSALQHKHKIFVAGNHDWLFETDAEIANQKAAQSGITYLQDSSTIIDGLKIYGSPWQPRYYDWAFNLDPGPKLNEKWKLIPNDTDILITHVPPKGILDFVKKKLPIPKTGCQELRRRVREIKPRLHVFGHIHSGYGQIRKFGIRFVNACNCDESYEPVQAPIVIDL